MYQTYALIKEVCHRMSTNEIFYLALASYLVICSSYYNFRFLNLFLFDFGLTKIMCRPLSDQIFLIFFGSNFYDLSWIKIFIYDLS